MALWYPAQILDQETRKLAIAILNDTEVKSELSKQIRVELDNQRTKYKGQVQSYEALTSGNVNMQSRMAASGYDVYGRTLISGNNDASNNSTYRRMKNKIKYGRAPQQGYYNRGSRTIQ